MNKRANTLLAFLVILSFSYACAYNDPVKEDNYREEPYVPPPPVPDVTPPGPVSSTLFTGFDGRVTISYVHPPDTDLERIEIRYATTLEAAADGTLVCENCNAPVQHVSLANNVPLHYALRAFDRAGNGSTIVYGTATPYAGPVTCDDKNDLDCLQIATFNLQYFPEGVPNFDSNATPLTAEQRQQKENGIRDLILNEDFDLVALQEIQNVSYFQQWVPQALGSDWAWHVSASGCSARTGLLYKKSLVTVSQVQELTAGNFSLGHWSGCLRRPLTALVAPRHSERVFRLVNVHLKAGSDSASCVTRQSQAGDLNGYLNTLNTAALLLGDYNDEVREGVGICSSVDSLFSLESNTGYSILTQTPTMPAGVYTNIPYSSTIDHLMVNTTFNGWLHYARDSYTADIIAHNTLVISDHQPAVLWLKLR